MDLRNPYKLVDLTNDVHKIIAVMMLLVFIGSYGLLSFLSGVNTNGYDQSIFAQVFNLTNNNNTGFNTTLLNGSVQQEASILYNGTIASNNSMTNIQIQNLTNSTALISEDAPGIKGLVSLANDTVVGNASGSIASKKSAKVIEGLNSQAGEDKDTGSDESLVTTSSDSSNQKEQDEARDEIVPDGQSSGQTRPDLSGDQQPDEDQDEDQQPLAKKSSEPSGKSGVENQATDQNADLVGPGGPADVVPPRVENIRPANAATGVPISTSVEATFSEQMQSSSITTSTFFLRDSAGNNVPGTVSIQAGFNTATFRPSVELAPSKLFIARITTSVKDLAGNAMSAARQWSFTTAGATPPPPPPAGDSVPPTVVSISPANGATGVPISTSVEATFSEQMRASTLTTSTFTLKDAAGDSVLGTVSMPAPSNTAIFKPSAQLAQSTLYTAVITTDVKDLAGNAMSATVEWSFTTAKPGGGIVNDIIKGRAGVPSTGEITQNPGAAAIPKVVTVTLNLISIDILNNHEGFLSGDGEFDLLLEYGSLRRESSPIRLPELSVAYGLWDVSNYERVMFDPLPLSRQYFSDTDLTAQTNYAIQFYFRTYGQEVDGCGRSGFGDEFSGWVKCGLGDDNERLGEVKRSFEFDWPTKFGKIYDERWRESSSSRDYKLIYQITMETEAEPPPPPSTPLKNPEEGGNDKTNEFTGGLGAQKTK